MSTRGSSSSAPRPATGRSDAASGTADIVFVASRPTTAAEVDDAFRQEAATERYQQGLGVSDDPLVSADVVGDPRAAVVDLELTTVVDGTQVKVMAWYDNEGASPTR